MTTKQHSSKLKSGIAGMLAVMFVMGGTLAYPIDDAVASTPLILFRNPKGGAPRATAGGASRGDNLCNAASSDVTAKFMPLVPMQSNYGLTTQEHPTFMVHIPPTSAKKVFFSLKNEAGEVHYQAQLSIKGTGEVLAVTLPETVSALKAGKSYEWGVAILCNGKLRPDSPMVHSWIERTELSPAVVKQIQNTSLLAQAQVYGENGIWYDMLVNLSKLQQQEPNDKAVKDAWKAVLTSAGLEVVSHQPL